MYRILTYGSRQFNEVKTWIRCVFSFWWFDYLVIFFCILCFHLWTSHWEDRLKYLSHKVVDTCYQLYSSSDNQRAPQEIWFGFIFLELLHGTWHRMLTNNFKLGHSSWWVVKQFFELEIRAIESAIESDMLDWVLNYLGKSLSKNLNDMNE